MEESQKRKERLKAMFREAAEAESSSSQNDLNVPGHLINPLAYPDTASPAQGSSNLSSRFDYYTDPMSAFSGNKRGSSTQSNVRDNFSAPAYYNSPRGHLPSPPSGPRNINMTPAPANRFQANYSPHQASYGTQSHSPHPAPLLSPLGRGSPFDARSIHQGSHGPQWQSPQSAPWLSPAGRASPSAARTPLGIPSIQHGSPSPAGYSYPHNTPVGGFSSPGGRGCSPSANNPGRGGSQSLIPSRGGFRGSPSYFGPRNSSSHASFGKAHGQPGWSSGSWKGSWNVSANEAPEMFYSKVMIMDPWKELTPVVGGILVPLATLKTPDSSWLPKSISGKKPKLGESGKGPRTQSGIAEFLAQAFEEAANDETETP